MLLKHIITNQCILPCQLQHRQYEGKMDIDKLNVLYKLFSQKYESIILAGGKPTLESNFWHIAKTAAKYFKNIYLTTSNRLALADPDYSIFTEIWFTGFQFTFPLVLNQANAFAMVNANQFTERLPKYLVQHGYKGLILYDRNEHFSALYQGKELVVKTFCNSDVDQVLMPNLKVLVVNKPAA